MERPEVAIRVFRIDTQEGFESTRVKLQEGKREARAREELPATSGARGDARSNFRSDAGSDSQKVFALFR